MGGASTTAPQRGQLNCPPSSDAAHQTQIECCASLVTGAGGAGYGWTAEGICTSGAAAAVCFTAEPHDPQKFAVSEILVPQFVQNI